MAEMRPHVTVNFAVTWDGKISTRNFTPTDFSSPRDKIRLLEIRSKGDALLVGKNTIEKDNMMMGLPVVSLRAARLARKQTAYPLRVLVSNSGRISPSLKVFKHSISPIAIYSTRNMPVRFQRELKKKANIHFSEGDTVDLKQMLNHLRVIYGVKHLVCEGGARLFRMLIGENLVDEIYITLCARIFGGAGAPTMTGLPDEFLPISKPWKLVDMKTIDDECFLRYRAPSGRRKG